MAPARVCPLLLEPRPFELGPVDVSQLHRFPVVRLPGLAMGETRVRSSREPRNSTVDPGLRDIVD